MTAQLSPDDLAALRAPVERAAHQHRIVTEVHACDTCTAGEVYVEGHWLKCLACDGTGTVSNEYRQEVA